jgi:hypothetical protein
LFERKQLYYYGASSYTQPAQYSLQLGDAATCKLRYEKREMAIHLLSTGPYSPEWQDTNTNAAGLQSKLKTALQTFNALRKHKQQTVHLAKPLINIRILSGRQRHHSC